MPRSSVTRVFIELFICTRSYASGRGPVAFFIKCLEIESGLAQITQLARNPQTPVAQGLDQRRQLAPLVIRKRAPAGECGHDLPVVIENGTSHMAKFIGRLLFVDCEPVRPASFNGSEELRGLREGVSSDGGHSLSFQELEKLRGCEVAAQNVTGRA